MQIYNNINSLNRRFNTKNNSTSTNSITNSRKVSDVSFKGEVDRRSELYKHLFVLINSEQDAYNDFVNFLSSGKSTKYPDRCLTYLESNSNYDAYIERQNDNVIRKYTNNKRHSHNVIEQKIEGTGYKVRYIVSLFGKIQEINIHSDSQRVSISKNPLTGNMTMRGCMDDSELIFLIRKILLPSAKQEKQEQTKYRKEDASASYYETAYLKDRIYRLEAELDEAKKETKLASEEAKFAREEAKRANNELMVAKSILGVSLAPTAIKAINAFASSQIVEASVNMDRITPSSEDDKKQIVRTKDSLRKITVALNSYYNAIMTLQKHRNNQPLTKAECHPDHYPYLQDISSDLYTKINEIAKERFSS